MDVNLHCNPFNTLVRSTTSYACEVWVDSKNDVPPSSLCDPKRVQIVGFAELVRNMVPLPASSTKRGRGIVLEAPGLD
jgi:hypothetical protein